MSHPDFPRATAEAWRELAEKGMRPTEFQRTMFHCPESGLRLEPFYGDRIPADSAPPLLDPATIGDGPSWAWIEDVASADFGDSAVASTLQYQEAGATRQQELALALADAMEQYRETGSADVVFQVAVDRELFLDIAKLRALRVAWERIGLYSEMGQPFVARIHAVTSRRMLSVREPWVNALRTSNACMSAILGGANFITTRSFDELTGASERGKRLAENTARILGEESRLGWVLDPARGSGYVEELTSQMAHMAWKRLQDIERAGGLSSALRDGLIDEWIENSFLEQRERVTRGAKPVVGVNAFPTTQTERVAIPEIDLGSERFPLRRDAEIFERLRDAVDILAMHQQRPSLFLSRIGTQNDSDQHVPAVRDAMKLVGVDVIAGNGVSDIEAAAKEFAASGLRCVCMCANVDFYREHAVDLGRALFAAGARCVIFAGSPDYLEVQLLAIGVRSFLYSTCDRLAAYQDILRAYDAELELEGDSE